MPNRQVAGQPARWPHTDHYIDIFFISVKSRRVTTTAEKRVKFIINADLFSLWLDLSSNRTVSHNSFHKLEETSTSTADVLHVIRGHVNVFQQSCNTKGTNTVISQHSQ